MYVPCSPGGKGTGRRDLKTGPEEKERFISREERRQKRNFDKRVGKQCVCVRERNG